MENKILQGYLSDFKADYNFPNTMKEDVLFEHFCNYCILSKVHPEAFFDDNFKIEEINVGGGEDTGIDGIAIVVNDHIVNSIDEINRLKDRFQRLDTRFIFTQSKTSSEFKSSEIGNFIYGVKDFFKDNPTLKISPEISELRKLKDHIYSNSILMDEPPICELHYITTGKWMNDQNVAARIKSDISELENKGLFKDIEFNPVDAESIEIIYKEIKNKVVKEINFDKNTPLPRIDGVKEAYIGILPISEYFNLITDSENKVRKTLFYDNVRDFLGLNSVNQEIQDTLRNKDKQFKFPIFNNGVTIVAKSLNKVGTYFKVKDFQIVNGCQTSNILFSNKAHIDTENTYLPIKLIVSDNQDVINDIIKATNRQTEVKIEAFESLKDFHKKLQSFYDTFPKETKLYYERRSREYDTVFPPIPRSRIITLPTQINVVISMFWNEPHSTHRYYGELLKAYSGRMFVEDHNPYVYYVSSLCLHKVDLLIKQGVIPMSLRHYKYHLLTVFRIIAAGFIYPKFNSKDINKYCDKIHNTLLNDSDVTRIFANAVKCINDTLSSFKQKRSINNHREINRLKDFTQDVIEKAKHLQT